MNSVDRSRLPTSGPEAPFHFPAVARHSLANGLQVWTVEHRDVPVLSFQLLLSSGAADDPAEHHGLAAITADMLDEGCGPRSALDIEDALARIGAQFDTEVGSDAAVLTLLTVSRFRDEALALLSDIAARPRFDAEDFSRVKQLRLTRLQQLRDLASASADRLLARLLYADHPYGHMPLGTAASLKTLTVEDAATYHAATWRPDRLTLVAVGDDTHEGLLAAAERAFGRWTAAGDAQPAIPQPITPRADAVARVALIDRPGAAQSEVRVGQVAVPRLTPDYHQLLVLNGVLGGQFVSRLNLNLREDKGYTYGARSGFEFRRLPGPFLVQAAVQTTATAPAVREILAELEAIRGPRPATVDEITMAHAALTRGYPRNFETAGQVGRGLSQMALYDLPADTFERFVPAIRAVDSDQVTRAAQERLSPSTMVVAVVGDRARIEPELKALGLGEVEIFEHEAQE